MAEAFMVNENLTEEEKYKLILPQAEHLLDKDDFTVTSLSNFTAILKQTFGKISWAGFYLAKGEHLFLGPFQGKVACTRIRIGTGVCGTAAREGRTVIVPDVNKFPGHIVCDAESKSEIVVPLIKNEKLIGVLDLDSTSYNSFNDTDAKYLEELCAILLGKINTEINILI
ncbi:MAG: GAF domain-containing protein [Ignavibacteriales bacterium]